MELCISNLFKTLLSNSMVLKINSNLLKNKIEPKNNENFTELLKRYDVQILTEAQMFNEKSKNPKNEIRWATKFYIKAFLKTLNDFNTQTDIEALLNITKYSLDIDSFYSRYSIEIHENLKPAFNDIIQVGFWNYVTTTSKCVGFEKIDHQEKTDLDFNYPTQWLKTTDCIKLTREYFKQTGFLIHDILIGNNIKKEIEVLSPIDIYEITSFINAKYKLSIYLSHVKNDNIYKLLEISSENENIKTTEIQQYKKDSTELSLAKWTFSLANSLHNQGKTIEGTHIKQLAPNIDGILALPKEEIQDIDIIVGDTIIKSRDLIDTLKIAIKELKKCKFKKGPISVPAEIIPDGNILSWTGSLQDNDGMLIKHAVKNTLHQKFLVAIR